VSIRGPPTSRRWEWRDIKLTVGIKFHTRTLPALHPWCPCIAFPWSAVRQSAHIRLIRSSWVAQLANVLEPVVLVRTGPIRSTVTICYIIGRSNFIWTVRSLIVIVIIRLHCLRAMPRCGLLLHTCMLQLVQSVCLCWAHGWVVEERLNWLRCCLLGRLVWAQGTMYYMISRSPMGRDTFEGACWPIVIYLTVSHWTRVAQWVKWL